ncbi:sensor histidine kinase [Dactylosporangium darangshiense]|uniref:histidine kinase n=1 Tax=Dactylosporangium darangshiense TaxID=579108 RepID=A0ABP8DB98_9ACTN
MTYLRGLARSAQLLGLAVLVFCAFLVTVLMLAAGGMVFGLLWVRPLTAYCRALFGRWLGRDLSVSYRPEPGPPQPDEEGFYRHDSQLYHGPRFPAYFQRVQWAADDPATHRDMAWQLWFPLVVLLVVPIGLPVAPLAVRAVAAWSAWMWRPRPGAKERRRRTDAVLLAWAQCAALLLSAAVQVALLAVTLACFLLGFGLGIVFLIPTGITHYRWLANLRRQVSGWGGGERIERPYQPMVRPQLRGDGLYRVRNSLYKTETWADFNARWVWVWHDPATWRDLLWLGADPFVTGVLAGVPVVAAVYGAFGLVLPWIWTQAFGADWDTWYGAVAGNRLAGLVAGVLLVAVGFWLPPKVLPPVSRWSALLLRPTAKEQLRRRVERLTQTRADAVDAQAAEVRRIERDLHDGAQARLISVGLTLGAIERLMDTDPEAARRLVAQARETSQTALSELRDLVRGILPPVLSERGLPDAVRALALDTSAEVTVHGRLAGRLAAPVESAAYFAVSELLANAVRHGGAEHVTVDIRHRDALLRITVTDDGEGGADPSRGTGLRGIERRLGTFDGTLALHSPAGGPTVATLELPCALSSPKTSTS